MQKALETAVRERRLPDGWSHTSSGRQDGPLHQKAGQPKTVIETEYGPLLAQAVQTEDTEAPASQLRSWRPSGKWRAHWHLYAARQD